MEFWSLYDSDISRAPERLETMAAHGRHDDLICADTCHHWSEAKEVASTWSFRCNHGGAIRKEINIRIQEMRDDGVLNAVGGELWEASILLCADMVVNSEDFEGSSALEFGAGVGLPSFFFAKKKALLAENSEFFMCITDFDPRCLANLAAVTPRLVDDGTVCLQNEGGASGRDNSSGVTISVERLDWFDIQSFHLHDRFDVAFGAALVYNNDHACLADICLDLLVNGRCKKVVIIQIKDRPGLTRFLTRAENLSLLCTVKPVEREVYEHARRISSVITSPNEADGCLQKLFSVPLELSNLPLAEEQASGHIVTERESFVRIVIEMRKFSE